MAVTYGFFNSINGDRTYNADQISNYFLKLISNGVFATPSTAMQVVAGTGLNVNVSAGWGFINCKWINNDALYSLQLDAADIVLDRIDRIVLHLDNSTATRSISIQVSKGTPGSTPLPPALVRSGDVYELSLAKIYVAANATAITQADITDERADTSVCGYVTGLIDQIDTTNLFAQFTAAFNAWFDDVKDQVKATTIVMQYQSRYVTTTDSETTIPIQISQFDENLDIMYVFINGIKLIPYVDYTIDGTNIELTQALDVIGTPVEFEVLKSVDTEDAGSIAAEVLQLFSTVEALENRIETVENQLNGFTFVKCTQSEYEAMQSHDENTVYLIVEEED